MKHIQIALILLILLLVLISCDQAEQPIAPDITTEQTQALVAEPEPPKQTEQITEQQTQEPTQEQTTTHTHTVVTDHAIAATCKDTGLSEGSHCSTCGQVLVAQQIVPVTNDHKAVTKPAVAATCKEPGYSKSKYCAICQTVIEQPTEIPALPHTPVTDPAIAPTCSGTGLSEGSHCSVCSTVIVEQVEVPVVPHEYDGDVCKMCKYPEISQGLDFELIADSYYLVSGLGTCTDTDIIIPVLHNGLPVRGLRYNAFENCTQITSVKLYDSATIIGDHAFDGCTSLHTVELSTGVTTLQKNVFNGCEKLLEIDVSHVQTFELNCFSGSYFSSVVLPDHAKIEGGIFANSFVQSVTFGACTQIPYNTFWNATLLKDVHFSEGLTAIGHSAFYGCTALESVTFPTTLQRIEEHAFSGCEKLACIDFSGAMAWFYSNTFQGCNLTLIKNWTALSDKTMFACSLYEGVQVTDGMVFGQGYLLSCDKSASGEMTVPDGIHTIDRYAFENCASITQIHLPDSLTTIEQGAFSGCSGLVRMELPEAVSFVGSDALKDCTSLTYVYLPDSLQAVQNIAIPTVLQVTISIGPLTKTLSDSLIDNHKGRHEVAFRGTMAEWEAYYAPMDTSVFDYATIKCTDGDIIQQVFSQEIFASSGKFTFTLTSDGTGTFTGQGTLPYYSIFNGCLYSGQTSPDRVCKIVIGEGITDIETNTHGESGFWRCTEIAEIVFPSTLTSINKQLFSSCAWYETFNTGSEAVYIGDTLCMVPSALSGTFVVRDGTVTIGKAAFAGCDALTEIILPLSVQTIRNAAFSGCESLTSITLHDQIKTIEYEAFQDCHALRELTIPGGVTSLRSPVVLCDGLKTLIITGNVDGTYTGGFASYCKSLETVVLGMGITELPINTLYDCPNLKYVIIEDTVTSLDYSAFWNTPKDRKFLCYSAQTAELLEAQYPGCVYLYTDQAPTESGSYWWYTQDGEIALYN